MTSIPLMTRLDKAFDLAASVAASLCLAGAAAAGFWQVVTRFIFENPSVWSEALVRLLLVWMVMIGLGVAIRHGALVSIDIAEKNARGLFLKVVRVAILSADVAVLGALLYFGYRMVGRVQAQEMAGLEISMAWGYAAIPVGAAFGILGSIANYRSHENSELENAT
ncbi:TRAP transporter small permease [Mongoliimonas terrestris]|uniref:TRAP transporter small permease n=1 Tax=Mongoliimonas terrestris TaxID=1709001 RepID=UPI000AF4614E|nr:TRAP transporter small permease [Mongoliimonas terrestris]